MSKKKSEKSGKNGKGAKKDKTFPLDPALAAEVAAEAHEPSASSDPESQSADEHYLAKLEAMQIELVKLQRHWIETGAKTLIILEGRDAAGKDGTLKAVTAHMSPRQTRVVALPKPNEREQASWYFQRYMTHLPAGGETVFFNRSWYNRAGVEPVMGFCTPQQQQEFLEITPEFESVLVKSGVNILKFYLDLSKSEQAERLEARRKDPLDFWKVGPIDAAAQDKWDDYTKCRNGMLLATHTEDAPWTIVRSNKKKRARLSILAWILASADYPEKKKSLATTDPQIIFSFEPSAIKDGRLAP